MTTTSPNIQLARDSNVVDGELEALLHETYVAGGFTAPEAAHDAFSAEAVRARGDLLVATDERGRLVGTVIVVPPSSRARKLADADEAEMHLLAVRKDARARGLGLRLTEAAMEHARQLGLVRMVLWTQPTMTSAQGVYARAGFLREPSRDFDANGRQFLVFTASLA